MGISGVQLLHRRRFHIPLIMSKYRPLAPGEPGDVYVGGKGLTPNRLRSPEGLAALQAIHLGTAAAAVGDPALAAALGHLRQIGMRFYALQWAPMKGVWEETCDPVAAYEALRTPGSDAVYMAVPQDSTGTAIPNREWLLARDCLL